MLQSRLKVRIFNGTTYEDLEDQINYFIEIELPNTGDDPKYSQVLNLNYQVSDEVYSCLISYRFAEDDGVEEVEHLEPKKEGENLEALDPESPEESA